MKDRSIESPMEKVQSHCAYTKCYLIGNIFEVFILTNLGGARFISHKFTNRDHSSNHRPIFCIEILIESALANK